MLVVTGDLACTSQEGNLKTVISVQTGCAEQLMVSVSEIKPSQFFFSAPYSGNGVQNHDTVEDFSASVK